ncbi:MAG: HD domain-containing protein [Candidatus Doudnabacteria bacterium]
MGLVRKATIKAMTLHQGQLRKDEETPFIVHPLEVAMLMARFTPNEEVIAAAILHDTIEDTKYTSEEMRQEFGPGVAELVDMVTENKAIKDWIKRKDDVLVRMGRSKMAMFLKSADAISNMRDLKDNLKIYGDKFWDKFNASRQHMMAYYNLILDTAQENIPAEMLKEYVSLLKDLEYSSNPRTIGFTG